MKKYKDNTFFNHKRVILGMSGIIPFQSKRIPFEEQMKSLVAKNLKPKKVLLAMVDWLRMQKIEVPTYHLFASSITELFNLQEAHLYTKLEKILTEKHKGILDGLMHQKETPPHTFKLTELKTIDQSEKPRKITASVNLFLEVKNYFEILLPCIQAMELSADAWRAYAHWVMRARSRQIQQLSNPMQRYLYLMAFIYHQYSYRQDFFIKIVLNTANSIEREHKKYKKAIHYENKEKQEEYIGLLEKQKGFYKEKWDNACKIISDSELNSNEKVNKMHELIKIQSEEIVHLDEQLNGLEEANIKVTDEGVYYNFLQKRSIWTKNRMHDIIGAIDFNKDTSDKALLAAIDNYRTLKEHAFCRSILPLFKEKQQVRLYTKANKPKIGLCKSLFYIKITDAIKSGELNLKYSYRYRSVEEYMIPLETWQKDKDKLIERAGLKDFISFQNVMDKLKKELGNQYERTNNNILEGKNHHVKVNPITRKVTVDTSGIEKPIIEPVADLLDSFKYTPIGDILSDTDQTCKFMEELQHRNVKYAKPRPKRDVFIAGLIGHGCNIGLHKMGQISRGINESTLNNVARWYFSEENLRKANDSIVEMTKKLPLYNLFKHHKEIQHTSSDGQKYNTAVESLNANYSFKYQSTGKWVNIYSFVDEAIATFYATVVSPSDRESTYVLDGLIHNEVYWEQDKKWMHHTDSHGQTEIMFAATNLLGISLSPRIKNLKTRYIYSFEEVKDYKEKGYVLCPKKKIDMEAIELQWDTILRIMVTLRLKECTASSLFARISSYAKQNPIYSAISELGKVYKSLFILKYYDELKLRQMIEKQLNKVERSHQFAHAVFFDNNRSIRQELKEDQDIAILCRVIIQNAIILWNCLHLSEKLLLENKVPERMKIIDIIKAGSACSWQHINMSGIYEFKRRTNSMKFKIGEILAMKVA